MANSDIIKIGFDYRASLAQFEKETNGVFDGISNKAGKQKITIQLDAKDDKVIDKIKELQKLKLDKFTFEFGNSGLKEQLQTFDKLENKINEIINLSKGIDLSFNTKNKTDAYNQLKKYADAFKDYYGNEEAMATNAGAKAGYAYYKAYEEALRKGVAQSKLEKVTIDFDVNDSFFSKERIVGNRIKEFENFQKYGNADESNLIAEITSLENRLLKFNSAYSQVKANLGDAPITPEITKNIEEYVRLLEVAESRAKDAELFGYSSEDINSDKDLANMYLNFAKEDATAENKKYIESLKQEETQAIATAEAEQKLAEAQMETVSNTSNSNNSQIEELKSDIQEVKTELGDVKDRISSIESNGFENVRDDVEKTKESAKELNSELTEMKSNLSSAPQESNISSGMKDTFPKTSENLEQVAQSEQKVQQEASAIQSKWEQAEKAIQNYMNAVTKLNNLKASDKSTGKKSYEIAGQIEEIEKLKKEAYDARQVLSSMINPQNVDTDTWKRYVDVINRLDQASNGSAESVNRLKDSLKNTLNSELNSLQNSIDKYQKIITQAQTYPSDFHPSTEYNTKLAKLESANEVLKNYKASLQGVTELTKEQQNQINRLTQDCEKAATEFKNLSAAEKGTIKVGVEKAIQRINKDLAENTKYSAEAKAGLNALLEQLKSGDPSINLRKITEEIIKIENAEIAAGRAGKSLWDIFKTKSTYGFIGQMQSYLSMYVGFYGMVNAVKKSISTITELDTALVDLKKTTAMNENQLENFYYDSNNVAKQMGVTTKEIIDQASAWSRLGYSSQETATTMAKFSSQFASISPGMSTDEAQEGLVSIMKAFDIDPNDVETEIMDKVNVLGNKFAENNQDVVEGLKRSAAAMSAMGQSFTDTAALFTGGMEILQDSESMGTALRTLSMRIRGYDEETNQLSDDLVNVTGEVADLTKTTKNAQGISLFTDASQEHYKSMVQYLGEITDEWDLISEKNQTELLQKLFGKNRANAGAAIIQNFDQVRAAIEAMEQSAGSSDKEMETIEQSLEYRINALKETWVGTIQQMVDRGDLGTIVDGLTKLSEGIGFVTSNLGLLKTAALGITGVLAFKNVGRDKMYSLSF
jgi:TP901 family phage tail tape measure protein|nr:MAG TPA: minor tail protein [Caudoviricetes sp.]